MGLQGEFRAFGDLISKHPERADLTNLIAQVYQYSLDTEFGFNENPGSSISNSSAVTRKAVLRTDEELILHPETKTEDGHISTKSLTVRFAGWLPYWDRDGAIPTPSETFR